MSAFPLRTPSISLFSESVQGVMVMRPPPASLREFTRKARRFSVHSDGLPRSNACAEYRNHTTFLQALASSCKRDGHAAGSLMKGCLAHPFMNLSLIRLDLAIHYMCLNLPNQVSSAAEAYRIFLMTPLPSSPRLLVYNSSSDRVEALTTDPYCTQALARPQTTETFLNLEYGYEHVASLE